MYEKRKRLTLFYNNEKCILGAQVSNIHYPTQ